MYLMCPNCGNQMTFTKRIRREWNQFEDNDYFIEEDDECHNCKIKHNAYGTWTIPDDLKPTEKQLRTIRFIENRLRVDISRDEMLTKRQCWKIISKYFEDAKATPSPSSVIDEDTLDLMGYDASYFC